MLSAWLTGICKTLEKFFYGIFMYIRYWFKISEDRQIGQYLVSYVDSDYGGDQR